MAIHVLRASDEGSIEPQFECIAAHPLKIHIHTLKQPLAPTINCIFKKHTRQMMSSAYTSSAFSRSDRTLEVLLSIWTRIFLNGKGNPHYDPNATIKANIYTTLDIWNCSINCLFFIEIDQFYNLNTEMLYVGSLPKITFSNHKFDETTLIATKQFIIIFF